MAVLEAFAGIVPRELANGNIVQLGDMGTFWTTLRSNGAATAEEFTRFNITEAKVHFRQGTEFRRKFNNLEFRKSADSSATSTSNS